MTIQREAVLSSSPVVLFIMLNCHHLYKCFRPFLSCGTVFSSIFYKITFRILFFSLELTRAPKKGIRIKLCDLARLKLEQNLELPERALRFFFGSRNVQEISSISQFSRVQNFTQESKHGAKETGGASKNSYYTYRFRVLTSFGVYVIFHFPLSVVKYRSILTKL